MQISAVKSAYYYNNLNRYYNNKNIKFTSQYLSYDDINNLISNGQIDKIKQLKDPYIINNRHENLLHSSCRNNQLEITKYLLYKKLNPNTKNFRGRSPFAIACATENQPLIESFLLYDVDINTFDNQKNTPLHKVVGNSKLVALLLNHGANPYFENEFEQTPFGLSLKYNKSLEEFLKNRTNPNAKDKNGQTLMHKAVMTNNIDAAAILKKYHGNVNSKDKIGKSPVFYTSNPEIIKWLCKEGSDINLRDNNGQTVLHQNVIKNDKNIAALLLKLNADSNIKDKNNLPPLYYAKSLGMMELLLKNNASPDVITPQGSTILENCVKTKNLKAVKLLLNYGANPNIPDKNKKTALDYSLNMPTMRETLLKSGANPNYRNYLIAAIKSNNNNFLKELLNSGADPNIPNAKGKTPLFFAKNEQQIDELVKYGAKFNVENNDGYSLIQHYALLGRKDLMDLLKNKYGVTQENGIGKDKTLAECFETYQKYNSWLKQNQKSQISFSGNYDSNDYRFYGNDEIRSELTRHLNLSQEEINQIIQTAPTTKDGIITAYNKLKDEEAKIIMASKNFNVIKYQYREKVVTRLSELYNKNPAGSKIPHVGIVSQYITTEFTDSFKNSLIRETQKLEKLYDSIYKNYYTNGLSQQIAAYSELNDYLREGIDYVNYIEGKDLVLDKLSERLKKKNTSMTQLNSKIETNLKNTREKYHANYDKLMDYQLYKQKKRTVRKSILAAIGGF